MPGLTIPAVILGAVLAVAVGLYLLLQLGVALALVIVAYKGANPLKILDDGPAANWVGLVCIVVVMWMMFRHARRDGENHAHAQTR